MGSIPENFVAATYREGGRRRDISLTECPRGSKVERVERRYIYEVYLERRDRKARKALKKMAGAQWCRHGKCWLVRPERVRDLIDWAEKFMAGGAWTDDETVPEWRGTIQPPTAIDHELILGRKRAHLVEILSNGERGERWTRNMKTGTWYMGQRWGRTGRRVPRVLAEYAENVYQALAVEGRAMTTSGA